MLGKVFLELIPKVHVANERKWILSQLRKMFITEYCQKIKRITPRVREYLQALLYLVYHRTLVSQQFKQPTLL